MPGSGADVLTLRALAKSLATERPIYGMQPRGIDGNAAPLKTILEIADTYLADLRSIQATGPYRLTGFSSGALVAYQMACLLEARGQSVKLAMLDPCAPGLRHGSIGILDRMSRLQARLTFYLNKVSRQPGFRSLLAYVIRSLFRENRIALNDRLYSKVQNMTLYEATNHAAANYRPSGYRGRAVLVRATVRPDYFEHDSSIVWSKLIRGGLDVYDVDCAHLELIREPYVGVVGNQLTAADFL